MKKLHFPTVCNGTKLKDGYKVTPRRWSAKEKMELRFPSRRVTVTA